MSPKDFAEQYPGKLVTIEGDAWAFVPDPIPTDIAITSDLQRLHEAALLNIGELRAVIPSLPNPKLFTSPFLRREAVKSSRIEGTKTEVDQLMLFEVSEKKTDGKQTEESIDAQEVLNYVRALEGAIDHLAEVASPPTNRTVDQWLIRGMHEELMQGVRGRDKHPGEYRKKQAFIGANLDIHSARFVPPPPLEVPGEMRELEAFIQGERGYPSLISIAVAHYQFETIHPFEDGNGRVGRLIIMLMLIQYGLLSEPLLYLSAYFERHRSDYNDSMWQVSRSGAWHKWIEFFLNGVAQEAKDAIARAKALLSLREQWQEIFKKDGGTLSPLKLVDRLFGYPVINVPTAQTELGMTYKGAQRNVEKLEKLGMLAEATGNKRNRVYIAKPIIDILVTDDIASPLTT